MAERAQGGLLAEMVFTGGREFRPYFLACCGGQRRIMRASAGAVSG